MNKLSSLQLLRTSLGDPTAEFRNNQWEAIDLLVNHGNKLLIVERTGWGKSSVYFISTRILRDQGKGPTIIISPLLALMRNQIESAARLGIKAVTINSTNPNDWDNIKRQVLSDDVDALLISPERLANEGFVENFLTEVASRVGLFVVDEAHCISDWGHDFRTDYRRITSILQLMPVGLPILATTATANNRVVQDIVSQLGGINIIRGSLVRESLVLQNIKMKDQAVRLAWLKENIPTLDGSGIIYTLTKRDAMQVSEFLNEAGIETAAYFSGVENDGFEDSDAYRQHLEDLLYSSEIKVLVATTALGMGYDKPDLGFVIHYQAPGSIISYYQQVGRAGRAIKKAYGILLSGEEDNEIHEHFMASAFPAEDRINLILDEIAKNNGLSVNDLFGRINLSKGQIEQVLKYVNVEVPSPVIKTGTKWFRTPAPYKLDKEKIARLTLQKRKEWNEVERYIDYGDCLMNYLQTSLDDTVIKRCGKCSRCLGKAIFPETASHENIITASLFLKHSEFDIKPRKQIAVGALPTYGWRGNLPTHLLAEVGKVLSRWEDAGWGKIVAADKHNGHFREELVDAIVEMITQRWELTFYPTWVTCVPSTKHPELIPDFAKRLAEKLKLPFYPVVEKIRETGVQKEQQNSYFQCHNLDGAFQINKNILDGPVFLIDDAIDSGWTFTIIAALLRNAGSGPVYPLALTSTTVS
ncbi:RecQ family ATP-dependent DNA helicase [Chitinophaga sp. LS1]|uniref:RecQ family ATP-dependent DNA helicase n=1 Tax=Chitinophaga sp. LS1 TaxID=3051176 RepID=UPI002AAC4A76|nr:RecQ family ATP-dependent DNA helicase [Chitinophaga sp. LS1]WPV68032.1 RecQ family ATP-dependent DNA helicase [Chitinophaga sp. LS1]